MNPLSRCILTPIDSLVVEGASISRTFLRNRSMAFSSISTFGTIFPFAPRLLMTLYPRKSNPSVPWVTFVFSSDNVSRMVLRNPPSSSFMAWASAFVPFQNITIFFFQAEDGIRDLIVTGVQTCDLPISLASNPGYLKLSRGRGNVRVEARARGCHQVNRHCLAWVFSL